MFQIRLAKFLIKLTQLFHFDRWERVGFEYVKMAVFGNDVVGVSNNGAIDKLVVVRVGGYHVELIMSIYSNTLLARKMASMAMLAAKGDM